MIHYGPWKEFHLLNTKNNIEAFHQWTEQLKSTILPDIKKIINCQMIHLEKVWIRKATAGYVYWVFYYVKELGNDKIGTFMALEKENSLELIDIMQGVHLAIRVILNWYHWLEKKYSLIFKWIDNLSYNL